MEAKLPEIVVPAVMAEAEVQYVSTVTRAFLYGTCWLTLGGHYSAGQTRADLDHDRLLNLALVRLLDRGFFSVQGLGFVVIEGRPLGMCDRGQRISQNTTGIVKIDIKVLNTTMEAASSGSLPYFSVSTKLITAAGSAP